MPTNNNEEATLQSKFWKLTGITYDIEQLIEDVEDTEDARLALAKKLVWMCKGGVLTTMPKEGEPGEQALLKNEIVTEICEALNVDLNSTIEINEESYYTEAEAKAYNLTLEGAWQYGKEKTPAVQAQNAVYAFESFDSQEKTTKYGDGTVEVIELREDGVTVTVLTNEALDPNAENFVGQSFNVNSLDESAVLQLFSTSGLAQDIWVTVSKQSDAVAAQDAVLYTNDEVDEHNASLTGAVKAGDKK